MWRMPKPPGQAVKALTESTLTGGAGDEKSYFEHAARRPLTVQ